MAESTNTNGRVRTGLFEIDPTSGEVYKSGLRVPIQEQPFRMLLMLLEHPGQIVTRQELKTRLWSNDTHVSFDEGLNTAIRKLRAALGDSAVNPRFIETIPKRGYRFIAPVSHEAREEAVGSIVDHSPQVTPVLPGKNKHLNKSEAQIFGVEARRSTRRVRFLAAALASLPVVVIAVGALASNQKVLGYLPLVLLAALLYILVVRRCWCRVPWFFSYTAFALYAELARFISSNHRAAYFWVYWTTEAAYAPLGVGVMYEVYRQVFGNVECPRWPRLLFQGMIVVSAVLAAGRGTALPPGLEYRAFPFILLGEIFVGFFEVLMFATLMTLVPLLRLEWRQYAIGVAAGFGVYSMIALLTTTRFFVAGRDYDFVWAWALIASYSCAVLIWLFFFSRAEKAAPALALR